MYKEKNINPITNDFPFAVSNCLQPTTIWELSKSVTAANYAWRKG